MDQRGQLSVIKFLAKEGVEPDEIAERLQKVFGDEALPDSEVLKWYDRVDGHENEDRGDLGEEFSFYS
jgi:hypothetical protein